MADSAAFDVTTEDERELASIGVGDLVRARRALWRVDARRREDPVTLLALHAEADLRPGRTLVAPFDRIVRADGGDALARVSRRRLMRRLASLVATSSPFDVPASVATAPVRLLPFQLEPLLCLRAGIAARVLVADRVGLGKTIQAALIARDLLAARRDASVLIVSPAGLRDQWVAELRDRTGLEAWPADADSLRARAAALPAHVNPWRSAPLVVTSIDFVKQADVRRGLDRLLWDLLVVDEAHTLTRGSDRLAAADALARRSDRVVLLTATPHDGRDEEFRALCELGRVSGADRLALFRRGRDAAGPAHRRVTRRLIVQPRDAERRLHVLLERYAQGVWRAQSSFDRGPARLAMAVLFKRAASSAASLARSLERRRLLVVRTASETEGVQTTLPLAAEGDEDAAPGDVLAAPGLDPAHERTWLNLLVHTAWSAARDEAKLRALRRLVRRVREPLIVFTEYRDTLATIEAALGRVATIAAIHGACTGEQRRSALRAFDTGAARVLLATDAASEGLNLQARCRLVVHVEAPWSPTRLEQRIGRVDRLGQTRTVHSLQLVAAAIEASIEARLAERLRRVHAALEPGRDDDAVIADAEGTTWPDLRDEAARAVSWLDRMRALTERCGRSKLARRAVSRPLVARLRRARRGRGALPPGTLHVYRTRIATADGSLIEHIPIVLLSKSHSFDGDTRRALDDVAARIVEDRAATLTSAIARADALVRLRRTHAVALLRSGLRQAQLSLFPDLDHADQAPESSDAPNDSADRHASGLAATAQLAAVLRVE